VTAQNIQAWECIVCGYIHEGAAPPDECPLCGAPRSEFKPRRPSTPHLPAVGGPEGVRVAVLGAGIAGLAAVESIRSASPTAQVTLISEEQHLPYQRLNLTRYLANEIAENQLPIHPAQWYTQHHLQLLLGTKAARIDLGRRSIVLADGQTTAFDKLILATGATAAIPPIPGAAAENVRCLRTLDDAKAVLDWARPGARCVCIGGGILGLEAAGALARRGVEVALIEGQAWLLPRQLNERASRVLQKQVTGLGIRLYHSAGVARIAGEGRAREVLLQDGSSLPTDFVILATGVKPTTALAEQCGLTVNRGILVNDQLVTSDPNVLAAGDVAEHRGTVYGLWTVSQIQGHIAGLSALGGQVAFNGVPRSNFLKVLGVGLFSIGAIEPEGPEGRALEQETDSGYQRFVFRGGRLVGAILLGDTRSATAVKSAIERADDLGGLLQRRLPATAVLAHLEVQETGARRG